MIDWLVKRLSPVKDKASRWVHLGEAIQEFWEKYFDPKLEELRGLRSIYTANEDGLKKLIAELGEFFEDTDRPIAVAWRKLELKFKNREFILTSSFSRKFKGLPVDWEPLFAPKALPYGTEFKPEYLIDNLSEWYLTSRGILEVDELELIKRGFTAKNFMDDAQIRAKRIKPLHIVFDGYKFLREFLGEFYWGGAIASAAIVEIGITSMSDIESTADIAWGGDIRSAAIITISM